MAAVEEALGEESYGRTPRARQAAFKRDRQRLSRSLGVEWEFSQGKYLLKNAGPYFSWALPDEALSGLAALALAISGSSLEQGGIGELLQVIAQRLPPEQQCRLEKLDSEVMFDLFQRVDDNPIPPKVWDVVRRAVRTKRQLSFNYSSPRYGDGQPRRFKVAPVRIVYQRGHWYLKAYPLERQVGGVSLEHGYRRFRLAYIQDDEVLAVLPTVIGIPHRRPPRYEVHYRLLPPLGRGTISRHFEEMEVTPLGDGCVEVRGVTDDLFEAERILLSYGQYCKVLGGVELKRRVEKAIRGMVANLSED